jgi:hypothetical protein
MPGGHGRLRAMPRTLCQLLALAFFCLNGLPAGNARAEIAVDLELVLAVDVSLSMDPEEQRLQREGYVAALRDPGITKAIQAGPNGRIAITYVEWAGPSVTMQIVPWRLIDGPVTAQAFTSELSSKEYGRYRRTSISGALEFSSRLFGAAGFRGLRRVIDVSGDGANNSGPALAPVRQQVLASGVVINGLPIVLRPTTTWTPWDIPGLEQYYANCVIGGPGSFMIPITRPEEFLPATRQKLLLEISGLPAAPRIVPAQHAEVPKREAPYDCTLVELSIRRW